jgi:hypothetical protein
MKHAMTMGAAAITALLVSTAPAYAAQSNGVANQSISAAQFTQVPAGAGSIFAPTLPAPGTAIILSEKTTKAIIGAFVSGGASAALAACYAVAPPGFKEACPPIVAALSAAGGAYAAPKSGYCLKIAVRLGVPPLSVSLVPCPERRPPDEDTYVNEGLNPDPVPIPIGPRPEPRSGGVVVPGPGGIGVVVP